MTPEKIPFNRPHMTGHELANISQAHLNGHLAGGGAFTKKCQAWLESRTGCARALLSHSCTAALEMAALLLELKPGDEVIMPSYTFVSTANAFALRGGVPVFVDIRQDTFNLDEKLIEGAIGPRTRAIVPVHYAGVSCAMDEILGIARRRGLAVVEDAAQGVMAAYKGKALGTLGDLGAYSFHETKNLISGEGGALLINDPSRVARAEIVWEKGTDRSRYFRGEVDKYTWQDLGSSFLPGEIIAAFLWAQFEEAEAITRERLERWNHYHALMEPLEKKGLLRRPRIPAECQHNAHMYQALFASPALRDKALESLRQAGIHSVFHYIPLHSSPAGKRYGRAHGDLAVTDSVSARLLRLPLWIGISPAQQLRVSEVIASLS